jgi:hypothetical protein
MGDSNQMVSIVLCESNTTTRDRRAAQLGRRRQKLSGVLPREAFDPSEDKQKFTASQVDFVQSCRIAEGFREEFQ